MWIRRLAPWILLGVLLSVPVASGLVPASVWLGSLVPLFAAYIGAMLLLFPVLMAGILYLMRQRTLAARYSGWAARHWPFAAQRRLCANQAANIYNLVGDPAHSAEYADLGIALNEPLLHLPRIRVIYAGCINVKGSLALNAGRYYEAFEAFYRPLRMNLENRLYIPLFLSNCAAAMYELGKFEEALEYTLRALAVNPPQQIAVAMLAPYNAALTLVEMGRNAEALAESQRALAVKMSRASDYRLLVEILHARLLALNGDREASEALFTELSPLVKAENRRLRQSLSTMRGLSRWEQGRFAEAETDLRLALEGPSVAPQCLYHLALIADGQGDASEAQEWRERLLREVPESFYAERIRQTRGTGVV